MKVIDNATAFARGTDDKNIPLDFSKHDFKFTRNWFKQRNQVTWSTYLKPLFDPSKPINAIQIGVFEFYDAAWLMQNVLIHKGSFLHAIDPWAATTKLDAEYMEGVFQRAMHNAKPWAQQVCFHRNYSENVVCNFMADVYDLVVIDGDHNAGPVYIDAVNALRVLRPGGVMVFDDVRNRIPKKDHVIDGIRLFLKDHGDEVRLLWQHRYADCYVKL